MGWGSTRDIIFPFTGPNIYTATQTQLIGFNFRNAFVVNTYLFELILVIVEGNSSLGQQKKKTKGTED